MTRCELWHVDSVTPGTQLPPSILLVDDDEQVARVVQQLLERVGLPVVTVPSVAEAEQLPGPFVVGVFDIELWDGCGVQLAERMLEEDRVGSAVFHTGGASAERTARALELGLVLMKGTETSQLRTHVADLVRSALTPNAFDDVG